MDKSKTNGPPAKVRSENISDLLARATIDALSAHICVLDRSGTIIAVNRAWRDFAAANQLSPEKASAGVNYLAVCDAAVGEDAKMAVAFAAGTRAVINGKRDDFFEEYPCHSPTEQRWFMGRVSRFLSNRSPRIVIAHENITARKGAEEALRQSERKYRRLHESMMDAFVSVDMTGRIIESNRAYRDLLGFTQEELSRLTYIELTPEKWHGFEAGIVREQILKRGYSEVYEKEYRRKDGTILPVELRTFLVQDEAGNPTLMWAIVRDITERKQAAETLIDSERNLSLAQRIAHVGHWRRDVIAKKVRGSEEAYRIFGLNPKTESIDTDYFLQCVLPEDRSTVEQAIADALSGTRDYDLQFRIQRPDRTVAVVHTQGEVSRDDSGRPLEMFGIVVDITRLKQAEESARKSERLFAQTFAGMLSAVFIIDGRTAKIIDCNPASSKIFGFGREEMLNQGARMLHVDDAALEEFRRFLRSAVDQQGHLRMEFKMKRKDGSIFPTEHSVMPILDNQGRVETWISAVRDNTLRIRALEALRLANAYNRSLIEASLDPLVTISPDGKITDVNSATERVTGCSRNELIGTDFAGYFTDPRKARFGYQRVFRKGLVQDFPLEIRHKDGKVTPVLYNASVYRDESGSIAGVFAAARDITERVHTESRLLEYQQRLRSMAVELSRAEHRERRRIATLLHDDVIQSLALSRIKLGALRDSMSMGGPADSVEDICVLIEDTIKHCRSLTFQLSSPILHELGLVAALEWLSQETAKKHNINCRFEDDGVPKPVDDDTKILLFTATRELLLNVVKHAQATSATVNVQRWGGDITITVADDGIGFDSSQRSGRQEKGSGFGLFNIKERLAYLGGRCEVRSRPKSGTEVILAFPLKPAG